MNRLYKTALNSSGNANNGTNDSFFYLNANNGARNANANISTHLL